MVLRTGALLTISLVLATACAGSKPPRPSIGGKNSGQGAGNENQKGENVNNNNNGVSETNTGAPKELEGVQLSAIEFVTAFPRLSHPQWRNAVRDLLKLSNKPTETLLPDPQASRFENDLRQIVTKDLRGNYQEASEEIGARVAASQDAINKIIPADAPASGEARVKAIVSSMARRAYRRTATDAEVAALTKLYNEGVKFTGNKDATAAGIHVLISALLQSPYFVYRVELGEGGENTGDFAKLGAFEIASRLSFGAWNSIPDDILLDLAASGEILKPATIKAQAQRLMKDPRAADSLDFFHLRKFGTGKYNGLAKDDKLFPFWKDMGDIWVKEAQLFVHDVTITQGKGLTELMTAPYTFVNAKSAQLYGVQAPQGEEWAKVELDPAKRAGIMTQVGFLAANALSSDSHIIARGSNFNSNIMCPEPFKGEMGKRGEADPALKTQRQKLESLTGPGSCGAGCHVPTLNPAGFAFENYDAVGRFRTKDNGGIEIDAKGKYQFKNGSIEFDGAVEFIKGVMERPEIHNCYVRHAIDFLYAKADDANDVEIIKKLGAKSMEGMSSKDIFVELLSEPSLIARRPNKEKP